MFYLLFKFKSLLPSPSKPSATFYLPAFPGELWPDRVCRGGEEGGDTSVLTISSVRRIIVSNNADLGVILATLELLMVTTTVIIQPRPWLCLLSTPSPRLSGWWQMPPPPPLPPHLAKLPSKYFSLLAAAVDPPGQLSAHFTLSKVIMVHHPP